MDTLSDISSTLALISLVAILLGIYLIEPIVYLLAILFRLEKSDSQTDDGPSRLSKGLLVAAIVISLPVAALSFSSLIAKYNQQRIDQSEAVASEVADQYFAKLQKDRNAEVKGGTLEENDAWDHRLRLTVQRSVFGYGVEVSSAGPDGKSNTSDDITVSRFHAADGQEFGWNLVQSGKITMEDWIKQKSGMLARANEEGEVKIEQEINGAKFSIKFSS